MTVPVCSIADHTRAKLDESWWASLPLLGVQLLEADETGPAETLEVKNCGCGSTLYRTAKPTLPAVESSEAA